MTLAGDGDHRRRSFCENETNAARLWGVAGTTPYPKDGIDDHVVHGAATVNPRRRRHQGRAAGTALDRAGRARPPRSACAWRPTQATSDDRSTRTLAARAAEADEFYAELARPTLDADEAR